MPRFYVYFLRDPADDAVFYVGKGNGNRVSHHEGEARRGKAGKKCERIRTIWSNGAQVKGEVIKWFDSEDDAFTYEAKCIADIGLHNLTNAQPGGFGGRIRNGGMPIGLIKREWKVFAVARRLLMQGKVILSGIDCTDIYESLMDDAKKAMGECGLNAFLDQREAEAYG